MRTKKIVVGLMALMFLFLTGCAWAGNIALTSIGQSSDSMMVKVVLKKMKVTPDTDNLMKAEDLEGKDILIAVVGGSSKGLGAAGIYS